MKIDEIVLNGFGKFQDETIRFEAGLNIVYGSNESGKSTLQAFIKAMLYSLDKKEEKRYIPWDQKGFGAANRLKYTLDNGQTYIVEKNLNRKTTSIFSQEPYQEITALFPSEKGNVLFMEEQTGLNFTCFELSVFIRQLGVRVPAKSSRELVEKLVKLSRYGDENIDYNGAVKKLNELKEKIGVGNTGKYKKLIQVNQLISTLEAEREKANANLQKIRQLQQQMSLFNQEYQTVDEEIRELSMLKQYQAQSVQAQQELLHDKLNKCLETKKDLEEKLSVYKKYSDLPLSKIEELEKQFEGVKVLRERQTELEEKLVQIQEQKDETQKNDGIPGDLFQNDMRVQLLQDKINGLKAQSLVGKCAAFLVSLLCLAGGLVLGKLDAWWYLLLAGIPAGIWWWVCYNQGVRYRMQQTTAKLIQLTSETHRLTSETQRLMDILPDDGRQDALSQMIKTYSDDVQQVKDRIQQAMERIGQFIENSGFGYDERKSLGEIINEIKQAFYERAEILKELQIAEKEAGALRESLQITTRVSAYDKTSAADIVNAEQYDAILKKYGIDERGLASLKNEKEDTLKQIGLSINSCQKEMDMLSEFYSHPGDIEEKLETAQRERDKYEETKEAVNLAKDFLVQALEEVQQNYTPVLNHKLSHILGRMTAGKYTALDTTPDLDIIIHDSSHGVLHTDGLSSGTVDQIYLSLRLAIAQMLSEGETLPLFIDEAFAQYDDERLMDTLKYIGELSKTHQIIISTCQQRELNILKNLKINHHMLSLSS